MGLPALRHLFGDGDRRVLLRFFSKPIVLVRRSAGLLWSAVKITLAAILFIVIIGNYGLRTDPDVAYRNIDPQSELCLASQKAAWSILSQSNVQNDEMRALEVGQPEPAEFAAMAESLLHRRGSVVQMLKQNAKDSNDWHLRLRCAVQRHTVKWRPRYSVNARPLLMTRREAQPTYDLAFLEFKENGDPYALADASGAVYSTEALAEKASVGQIEALARHLRKRKGQNFVIIFVHGWRHDASLGDGNVADLRVYAARVAKYLTQRCEFEGRYCDAHVTAVYVGWRGARVDERQITRYLGPLGEQLGQIAAIPTLFDRKPVSEAVAPSVVSAIRAIDANIKRTQGDRVIVFGHSLGGNMLLTGLSDTLTKQMERRALAPEGADRPAMKSPIGDLVVLINPASEAAKWTQIQKAAWRQLAMMDDDEIASSTTASSHKFFDVTQKPVIVSATAALAWPPGGIRPKDCVARERDRQKGVDSIIGQQIDKANALLNSGIDYDFATHDLFPAFKGDLRPVADQFDRLASRREARGQWDACHDIENPQFDIVAKGERIVADVFRNLPFMNTDREQTHTVGHLDPPRNVAGTLNKKLLSWRPFGATHEISGRRQGPEEVAANAYCEPASAAIGVEAHGTDEEAESKEKSTPYFRVAGADPCDCASATGWLYRARQARVKNNGLYWDSTKLGPPVDGFHNSPALRFVHGFENAGIAAITRANDPFWNLRAFDNALAKHDGYMLSSFICAISSLVMDDIIDAPPPPPPPTTVNLPEQ